MMQLLYAAMLLIGALVVFLFCVALVVVGSVFILVIGSLALVWAVIEHIHRTLVRWLRLFGYRKVHPYNKR